MNKRFLINMIALIILLMITIIMIPSATSAYSISKTSISLNVGKTATITINASGETGRFDITSSDSGVAAISQSSVWAENNSISITITAKAVGTATITVTPTDVSNSTTGSEVSGAKTVAITVSETTPTPEPTFQNVNQTVYAKSEVNVRSSYSTSSSILGKLQKGDSVTRTGIGNNGWSKVTYNGKTAYINSSYLTTEKPEEVLGTIQSLAVTGYELSPAFNPEVKSYTLNVSEEVEQIEVVPTMVDANATYEITGNTELVVGENIVNVIVTAKDGTKSTYEIKVIKGVPGLQLSSLILKGINNKGEEITINLDPTFSPVTKEYKANLAEFIKSIAIQATANNENAQIEIVGADELKVGQNTIEIIVKLVSGEKEDIVNYTISLDNPAEAVAKNSIKINKTLVAIIAAISLNTTIGIVLAVSLYRKQDISDIYTGADYDFLNGDKDFSETKVEDKTDFKDEKINPDRNNIIGDIFGDKGFGDDRKKGGKHF